MLRILLSIRVLLVVAAVHLGPGDAWAQIATSAPPDPAPVAGSPDQNIYYGATPDNGANAPVIVFVHGLHGAASDWWIGNDMYSFAFHGGFRTAFISLS